MSDIDLNDLPHQIARITGIAVPPGQYSRIFTEMNRQGRVDILFLLKVCAILCRRVELLEKQVPLTEERQTAVEAVMATQANPSSHETNQLPV